MQSQLVKKSCAPLKRSWRALFTAMCALTTTACSSYAPPSPPVHPPAVLLRACPPIAPPTDGTGAAVLRWSVDLAGMYNDCAARHRALARAVTAD